MSDLRDITEMAVTEGMTTVIIPGYAARRQRDRGRVRSPGTRSMARQLGADLPEAVARGWVSAGPSLDGPLAIGYVNGAQ